MHASSHGNVIIIILSLFKREMAIYNSLDYEKQIFLMGPSAPYRAIHFCQHLGPSMDFYSQAPLYRYTRVYEVDTQTAFNALYSHCDMFAMAENRRLTACPAFLQKNSTKMYFPPMWGIDVFCHLCNVSRDDDMVSKFVSGDLCALWNVGAAGSNGEMNWQSSESSESGYESPAYLHE